LAFESLFAHAPALFYLLPAKNEFFERFQEASRAKQSGWKKKRRSWAVSTSGSFLLAVENCLKLKLKTQPNKQK
jgi:hypothetical protein